MQDSVAAVLDEQTHEALASAGARSFRRIPCPAQKVVHLGRLPKEVGLNVEVMPDPEIKIKLS